ncbi:MAG: phenylalanine--tRNA ligase subunit beta [Rickettsiaceae bacterium]
MKFTLSWLKQFLETDASLEQIAHTLTMTGLEVEAIDDKSKELAAFEVAEIIEAVPHPDADKLKVCKVKTKSETLQIVCGAANARAGIKVVLARVGTLIPNGNFKIKEAKIRGVDSYGMMCSAEELGIGKDSAGIIELENDACIGDPVASYLGADDPVIHINITPNRADALGVYGIARDLAASGVGKLKGLSAPEIKESFKTAYSLSVKDSNACPLFAIREIKALKNTQSPKWLKQLLENIGIGSISAVVDVTNYISYTFGQPMHAYDAQKINDGLVVDVLASDNSIKALNGKDYTLQAGDIVIGDQKEIHCLAGIIGGINSSCTESTTNILLEAACFNSPHITRTGRRILVDTDSRYRFERNVDREFTLKALDFATNLITEVCGGMASEVLSVGSNKVPSREILFPIDFLHSRTNLILGSNEVSAILEKLGFKCIDKTHNIHIEIPSWRYDVSIKEDIVEEIVRIYGYNNIPQNPLPPLEASRLIPAYQKRMFDFRRLLAIAGYTEVVSWSFMDSKKAAFFTELKDELTLQNPISSDLDYMRPSILPNLLQACLNNLNRSVNNLSLFEIGPVFKNTDDQVINHAAAIRVGHTASKNSHGDRRNFDLFDIKADVAELLEYIGLDIDKCQIKGSVPAYYHPTKAASICLGKNILGYFGQVHPLVLKKFDIEVDVIAFELDITALPFSKNKFGRRPEYAASNYQMVIRDYAFIVDASLPASELLNFIKNADKNLIKAVDLFDIYSGEKVEYGKKSVALSVTIQDDNKTLTEGDIAIINKKIIEGIQQKFNGTLRDN